MLTDLAIKALKSKDKPYKVADRDGMYVHVTPTGGLSFRLDYRLNGRRETVHLGKYGPAGLSLARAREKRRQVPDPQRIDIGQRETDQKIEVTLAGVAHDLCNSNAIDADRDVLAFGPHIAIGDQHEPAGRQRFLACCL